ncbi:insecticidal delta-endotoxin Cry8Ea1 family protein [Dyella mobilis]|uniref:Pesticidal crystal protein domain-containing protein n=1 Tax=Dyella mobilis TaxID=1849582 RepID=A0ABS2KBV9_9GAMM|nr:insecticidal delta-endotoxin Cry8Ea1 family protein [Dyella mobilis]MBM7128673.1 hypothetical protein [Dyella mobilis]GLQ98995.1 hypothetical protein GCM10007863_34150 [Dyella mobilis]
MQIDTNTELGPAGIAPTSSLVALDENGPLQNVEEDIKVLLCTALSQIPYVGSWLSAFIGLLWPIHQPSTWDQIKDRLAELIDDKIELFYEQMLKQTIDGLHGILGDYVLTIQQIKKGIDEKKSPNDLKGLREELRMQATAIQGHFQILIETFTGASADTGWKVLPLYVQAANLHMTFLADYISPKNAKEIYGLDDGVIGIYRTHWKEAVDKYAKYVDDTLPKASAEFKSKRDKRAKEEWVDLRVPFIWSAQGSGIATGAWEGQRELNDKENHYTLQVRDFRELWKSAQDPTQAHANRERPALTRELWYGPYGVPSVGDSGGLIGYKDLLVVPSVPAPMTTPLGRKLGYISGRGMDFYRDNEGRNHWDFPTQLALEGASGPTDRVPNATFNLDLNDPRLGGPVIKIDVHIGHYLDLGSNVGDVTGGYLISSMNFIREGNPAASNRFGDEDSYGQEMLDYKTEAWIAPPGHALVNIFCPSHVKKLWDNRKRQGQTSIGSVMFSCRLKDPTLAPTSKQIALLYVTSPVELSVDDLTNIGAESTGTRYSEVDRQRLAKAIDGHKSRYLLEDYRKRYWESLKKSHP